MSLPLGPHNIYEFLSAFADGELDAAQNLAVLDYIESHPESLGYLRDRQHLRQSAQRIALNDENTRVLPDTLKARLGQIAANAESDAPPTPGAPRSAHGHRRWWPRGLSVFAAGLLVGGLVGGYTMSAADMSNTAHTPPELLVAARPMTPEEIDMRDAAIPVLLVRAATHVHLDCSRLDVRLHAGGYPVDVGPLAPLVQADFNSPVAAPDLTAIGYHFVGAGPCPKPLQGTVHLLYKQDGPEPRAAISVFAQAYHGQFALTIGRMYCIRSEDSTFPLCAWRTNQVVYFLISDDIPSAVAARHAIPEAPTRIGA